MYFKGLKVLLKAKRFIQPAFVVFLLLTVAVLSTAYLKESQHFGQNGSLNRDEANRAEEPTEGKGKTDQNDASIKSSQYPYDLTPSIQDEIDFSTDNRVDNVFVGKVFTGQPKTIEVEISGKKTSISGSVWHIFVFRNIKGNFVGVKDIFVPLKNCGEEIKCLSYMRGPSSVYVGADYLIATKYDPSNDVDIVTKPLVMPYHSDIFSGRIQKISYDENNRPLYEVDVTRALKGRARGVVAVRGPEATLPLVVHTSVSGVEKRLAVYPTKSVGSVFIFYANRDEKTGVFEMNNGVVKPDFNNNICEMLKKPNFSFIGRVIGIGSRVPDRNGAHYNVEVVDAMQAKGLKGTIQVCSDEKRVSQLSKYSLYRFNAYYDESMDLYYAEVEPR